MSGQRSGLRIASQRSSKRIKAGAPKSWLRWILPCSRATTSANSRQSLGSFNRSQTCANNLALRCSWPKCLGHWSGGVVPLPRSCSKQARRTGNEACRRALMSSTIMRCTPVSTSGWCSARWGTPHKRSTSGNKIFSAPHSRSTSNMREGRWPIKPLANSCQTRSGTR